MFIDYYSLLQVSVNSTPDELKRAYRVQCLKWHPDKNPNEDTTERMQLIVEAYLILKDTQARERYNAQYFKYVKQQTTEQKPESNNRNHNQSDFYKSNSFEIEDEILKKWIQNAKRQSKEILETVIDEFKGAIKEGSNSIVQNILTLIIPMLIGFLLFKSCT